jgi:hypothetical protein
MKQTGQSYVEAMGMVLQQRPDLYADYEKQKAAGETFDVPDQLEGRGFVGTQAGQKRKSGNDTADFDDPDDDEDDVGDPTKRGKRKSGVSADMLARR